MMELRGVELLGSLVLHAQASSGARASLTLNPSRLVASQGARLLCFFFITLEHRVE